MNHLFAEHPIIHFKHLLAHNNTCRLSTYESWLGMPLLTLNQARLTVQYCAPEYTRGKPPLRLSEEKLDGQCKRLEVPLHG
ncbi:hypothetical protein DPMN_109174 [Dreissena polymorpha]|uniref:Uncharacterized protein n=1 Tax=Dreissena polymorpha TaxID=45954 RepID=A0A9D4KA70_DREPO|nr:hypothetical protein DPMN_052936 [Dreissena polymorpha]KAH3835810.1 hypothetical protein DPMN_109174 [Dreissena polymorpha]